MNVSSIHPEDLLDKERQGTLSDVERYRLEQHVEECADCAIERSIGRQMARHAQPGDDALLIEHAIGSVLRQVDPAWMTQAKRPHRLVPKLLVAAAVLLVGGAAAALWLPSPAPQPDAPATAPIDLSDERPFSPSIAPAPPVAEHSSSQLPEAESEDQEPGAPVIATPGVAPEALTPAELFQRAQQARRHGKLNEAVRLFRRLQSEFPSSRQQMVSRITLGQLLLDRMNDPSGALVQFDAYLARGGSLREEAMVGRARSLARLGAVSEERLAWQAVLRDYPNTTYVDHARQRISATAPAPPD